MRILQSYFSLHIRLKTIPFVNRNFISFSSIYASESKYQTLRVPGFAVVAFVSHTDQYLPQVFHDLSFTIKRKCCVWLMLIMFSLVDLCFFRETPCRSLVITETFIAEVKNHMRVLMV